MISIIIPTYNEEECLDKLLVSIKKQDYKDYEIIVADANSKDSTCDIARNFGATVCEGGLPSVGRNAGSKIANGDYLLFLDADTVLPKGFLRKAIREFDRYYYEIASFYQYPISDKHIDKVYFKLVRNTKDVLGKRFPFMSGANILITKRLHKKIKGFNEKLKVGEDNDYGNRAKKIAKFGLIENTHVKLSVRRYEKEGRIKLMRKYLTHGIFTQLKKIGIEKDIEYEFGDFSKVKDTSQFEDRIEELLKIIDRIRN